MIPEQRARRDAEQSGDFTPSLTHTLNNLLQVVNGNLELLLTKLQDEQLRVYVRNAQLAAQQITELARSMSGRSRD